MTQVKQTWLMSFYHSVGLRFAAITLLGFASGLPLALTGTALQAWLTSENIDIATIGFFSLVGLPYTFKFLWAPLMDRFEPPWLGRRRGWLVTSQLGIALILFALSWVQPGHSTEAFALIAALLAFLSASQDVVVDAYRTDNVDSHERGMSSSLYVVGYRVAMILSGGIAFVWADPVSGNGWSWAYIYQVMAVIMFGAMIITCLFVPPLRQAVAPVKSRALDDVRGFLAVVVAVVIGYLFTGKLATPLVNEILGASSPEVQPQMKKWADLLGLFLGLGFTVPLVWWAAKKANYETLNRSLRSYFTVPKAMSLLGLIILYKLGDAFAGSLLTPFLLKGVEFSSAEVGVVNKVLGLWLTIFGALAGGALMLRLGLYRSLMFFGVLQLLSNLGFWLVADLGKGAWGGFTLPAFDLVLVSLKEATHIDHLLLFAVGVENITGGMGTAAFVALLMSLCHSKFTATQYALLSAFASVGRVWVGPFAGALAATISWSHFFLVSLVMAVPSLWMLWILRDTIKKLETPQGVSALDD
jgi:PAT family beta-lactamase induction signal transducer AmpG